MADAACGLKLGRRRPLQYRIRVTCAPEPLPPEEAWRRLDALFQGIAWEDVLAAGDLRREAD